MRILHALCLAACLSASVALPSKRATVCNGHAELCSRGYGNTTFLGSHDSFAFSKDPLALARDQEVDIPTQLSLGVRFLQAQSHETERFISAIQAVCDLFDGGLVVNYLKKVKTFLDANPNEVLTLLFTNPEGLSLTDVWKPAFDDSGITPFAYVPPTQPMKRSDWPTLGELIDSGKRVIVFLDAGADGSVDFLLPEFSMLWEPPFSSTDPNFPCRVDRIDGPLSPEEHLHMLNHNLNINIIPIGDGVLISDREDAPKTNGVPSILADASGCAPFAGGQAPNFVMLDYVNVGEGKKAMDILNGFA
ncbi:PLC-like phosphodiesterase [Moniliophthora roreri]|uniref:PLC-like phosphodiesterase n=1 Tax=Moniliophthora roreri TaxID=221103 RepID=A0A0W0EUA0_MONRR|nr:PLC-like phosphodiesterase [Moniliophthora roreri]